jgi:hypothetical protein
MNAHQIFRLRNPVLLMALAAVFPVLSYAASAANVDFAVGNVTAVNAVGVQRPLSKGAEIGNGDTIRTGDGGRVQVRFSDGAMVSLQPETDFRVDDYQYSGKTDGQEKGFFSLLKGGLRTITGLVGRSNRDNYKVTTSVATIGIRGTEYTGAFNSATGELVVNTGEGLVEVCNGAGCMMLAPGQSGTVTGPNSSPRRTDSRPQLSPAQPGTGSQQTFSSGENRGSDGKPAVLSASGSLVSGINYAAAFAAPTLSPVVYSPGVAIFDSASELLLFTDGSHSFVNVTSAGSFSVDGVIGWGRWSSGISVGGPTGSLTNLHYVTGIPAPVADLTALGGLSATYSLIGFTLPTSADGTVGGSPSGTLKADFGSVSASLTLDLNVPIGGTTYNMTGSGFTAGAGPKFSISGTVTDASGTFATSGFFAGANASHAGLTYKFDSGNSAIGNYVSGATAFQRGAATATLLLQ